MRYVAFLRGINVGGHRPLPMAELRTTAEAAGFANVATYIQSGNLFLDSEATAASIATRIHDAISERFDYDLPVVVRSLDDMTSVVSTSPYAGRAADEKHLHVGFLSAEPNPTLVECLDPRVLAGEEFEVVRTELYLHLPHGSAKSKLLAHNFAKSLGVEVTVRNWRTVKRSLELLTSH